MRDRADRRNLATVLFVDVVDSTRIAADVGDRRWRELLGSFRRVVRRRLKAEDGHEQDTAGDGFFATFGRPASAIRAAAGILSDVQAQGLDVRFGLHTGEIERIDGHLGGIAAHIGARVLALAEPAEVLVTGTVHDLVVGGGISFTPVREVALKGVPGRWALYRVTHVDGLEMPPALEATEAARRRGTGAPPLPLIRRPRLAVIGAALLGATAIAALGAVVLTLPRENPSLAGAPSASPAPSRPPSIVRIDPNSNEVVDRVYDNYLPVWADEQVLIVDGALWQQTAVDMVRRDVVTGEVIQVIRQPANTFGVFFAFGALWFDVMDNSVETGFHLHRADPLSGRETGRIDIEEPIRSIAIGDRSFFVLTDAEIVEIDPESNKEVDRDRHGLDTIPDALASVAGALWVCECDEGRITQWNPESDASVRTIAFPQRGFILEDQRELSRGPVAVEHSVVWLIDHGAGTITPIDTQSGEAGQPVGIPRESSWSALGFDSIWIAADDEIYRLDLETRRGTSIPLPDGVHAGGLAVDEQAGVVWVGNHVPRGSAIPPPMPSDSP